MPSTFNSSAARECIEQFAEDVLRDGAPIGGGRADVIDGADVCGNGGDCRRGVTTRERGLRARRTDRQLGDRSRSEEHTSELQSRPHLVCRLLLEKKKNKKIAERT